MGHAVAVEHGEIIGDARVVGGGVATVAHERQVAGEDVGVGVDPDWPTLRRPASQRQSESETARQQIAAEGAPVHRIIPVRR